MRQLTLIIGIFLALTGIVGVCVLFLPPQPVEVLSQTFHYTSYEDAIEDFSRFDASFTEPLSPLCPSQLLTSGQKESKALILFHGYTNCPKQFEEFAQRMHAAGYNVLIPRAPGHGYQDRMSEALASVTAEQMQEYILRSVAIAEQIGDEVTIVGLSGGGTFALWSAMYLPDIDHVVSISPVTYPWGFSPLLQNFVIKYAALTPNTFKWWDETLQNDLPAPAQNYRRYATKSMATVLHMTNTIEYALKTGAHPKTPVTFIINQADKALRPKELLRLAQLYSASGAPTTWEIFPESMGLPHDLIDPVNIKDNKEYVYDILEKSIMKQ